MRLRSAAKASSEPRTENLPPSSAARTKLIDLPNELLLSVFYHCEDVETGQAFSATSRQLHELWLSDKNQILYHLLEKSLPVFDIARKVAITEIQPSLPERNLSMYKALPSKYIDDFVPIIIRNHKIGKNIWTKGYKMKSKKKAKRRPATDFTEMMTMFYIVCDLAIEDGNVRYQYMQDAPSYVKLSMMGWKLLKDVDEFVTGIAVSMKDIDGMSIYGQKDLPSWLNREAFDHVWMVIGYFTQE